MSNERSAKSTRSSRGRLRRDLVSLLTVNRLSVYLRSLRALEARGLASVSSQQLADEFNLSASQIRKDLAQFGEFGVRGIGYGVAELAAKLSQLLGLEQSRRVVIVGMGNLGTALARYPSFNSASFLVVAGFDSDAAKVGRKVGRVHVHPMSALRRVVRETGATMAILATPADAASGAHRSLAEAGIRAILNFAPVSLVSTRACRVKNLDLRIHLEELAFFFEQSGDERNAEPSSSGS